MTESVCVWGGGGLKTLLLSNSVSITYMFFIKSYFFLLFGLA